MNPDPYGAFANASLLTFIISILVWLLLTIVSLWIFYAIVWRAVRRGLREFHYERDKMLGRGAFTTFDEV